jgi:hypothetical protein
MKKQIITLALILFAFGANAQDLTSKNGFPILPEEGDWSLSFDAVPFLDYAFDKTRIMSSTPATSSSGALNYRISNTIVGKYMAYANTAYRLKARIQFNRNVLNNYVPKDGSSGEFVKDKWTGNSSNITLGAGLQFYRGKGRLRGYYGAEAEFGVSSGPDTDISYGNEMTAENKSPTSTVDFIEGNSLSVSNRVTATKSGIGFNLGVRGFVGAEYFFAPKMSIGTEFGWGPSFNLYGEGEVSREEFDTAGNTLKKTTAKTGAGSGINLDVDNVGASLNLAIYF